MPVSMMYAVTPLPLFGRVTRLSSGRFRWSIRSRPQLGADTGCCAFAVGMADTAELDGPVPTEFAATAVKEYVMPFVRPLTMHDSAPVVEHVPAIVEPVVAVTRYEVTALPPSEAGADHATPTRPSPAVAARFCGAPGTVSAVRGVAVTTAEYGLSPYLLRAFTRKATCTSGARPLMVADVAVLTPSLKTVNTVEGDTAYSTT